MGVLAAGLDFLHRAALGRSSAAPLHGLASLRSRPVKVQIQHRCDGIPCLYGELCLLVSVCGDSDD